VVKVFDLGKKIAFARQDPLEALSKRAGVGHVVSQVNKVASEASTVSS